MLPPGPAAATAQAKDDKIDFVYVSLRLSGSLTLRQFVATLWTDSTLGTASTESQFALKELRVERGLSCFSSRY